MIDYGSSPRVWGTVSGSARSARHTRFIPTRVGNGLASGCSRRSAPVHPHACGERTKPFKGAHFATGSSPRVWGTGQTTPQIWWSLAVHPHACGERLGFRRGEGRRTGSSPRVWGTGNAHHEQWVELRFIPTRVGNGPVPGGPKTLVTVHPHACGERRAKSRPYDCGPGSSPRVWGTASARQQKQWPHRFIPTRVGNGTVVRRYRPSHAVHPHACGERPAPLR